MNKSDSHIEDLEIDLPNNPNWRNFKLRVQSIEQMERAAWEAFIAAQF